MATKNTGVPCYDKADPDEPLFVLRAQDLLAPVLVRAWAFMASQFGVNSNKVEDAKSVAKQMIGWRNRRLPD